MYDVLREGPGGTPRKPMFRGNKDTLTGMRTGFTRRGLTTEVDSVIAVINASDEPGVVCADGMLAA